MVTKRILIEISALDETFFNEVVDLIQDHVGEIEDETEATVVVKLPWEEEEA